MPTATSREPEPGLPRVLETHAEWRSGDVVNPESWTVTLSENEREELHEALQRAQARGVDLIDIRREDFPLPDLSKKLQALERAYEISRETLKREYQRSPVGSPPMAVGVEVPNR